MITKVKEQGKIRSGFITVLLFVLFLVTTNCSYSLSGVTGKSTDMGIKEVTYDSGNEKNPDEILSGFLKQQIAESEVKDASYNIQKKKMLKDGSIVYKIQQTYHGFPVFGYIKNVSISPAGIVTTVSGKDLPLIQKTNEISAKKILSTDAIKLAENDLGFIPQGKVSVKTKKVLYLEGETGFGYCCFMVRLSFLEPEPGNWYYFVDVFNGKIINKYNHLDTVKGTVAINKGLGIFNDTKNVDVVKSAKYFYLQDNTRGNGILTYSASSAGKTPGTLLSDSNGVWDSAGQKAAVDAHYFAGVVYDFYKDVFDRNSFDNNGAVIKSTVHYKSGYNNAFWNGEQMVYGDGDGKMFLPLSGGLDIVAHELTHAFTEDEANLIYQNESGAISEALSDIFATLVEFRQKTNPNWLIGEDVYTPGIKGDALRSLENPRLCDQPDNYHDRYIGFQDNGGVHINSGIINKAAYLISEGGVNNGVIIQGIGRGKLGDILYRTVCNYLTPNATFLHLKAYMLKASADLYGGNSKEVTSVNKAFSSVGIN